VPLTRGLSAIAELLVHYCWLHICLFRLQFSVLLHNVYAVGGFRAVKAQCVFMCQELMKILYLDPDLNNLQDIAYNPGAKKFIQH